MAESLITDVEPERRPPATSRAEDGDISRPSQGNGAEWAQGFESWCERLTAPSDLRGRDLWKFILGAGLFGAAGSVIFRGFFPTLHNGVAHVPYLKHRIDSSLYPGDLLIEAHENYYSLLWELVAGLATIMPLFSAMFIFYVIQQLLFHTAVSALAYRLGKSVLFTLVCNVFFMLWLNPGLGGSNWSSLSVAHSAFSFPFFIFATVALLDRRVVLAAVLWALGAQFHLPNAVYCAPMMGIMGVWALATDPRGQLKAVIHGAIAAVIAGAALLWAASQVWVDESHQLALTMEELRLLTRNRVGPHIFIEANYTGTTSRNWYRTFLAQGMAFGAVSLLAWRAVPIMRPLLLGMVGLFGVLALGIAATEVLNSVELARMMLLRVGDFLGFFFLLVPLALGGAWVAGRLPLLTLGLPFFVAFMFAGTESWGGNRYYFRAALIVVIASFVLWWWLRSEKRASTLRPLVRMMPAWFQDMPASVRAVFLFMLIALPGMALAVFEEYRSSGGRVHEAEGSDTARDWNRVQRWARQNTSKDTVFLTPPLRFGWRTHSERGTFIELRDGNPIVLNNNIHAEFRRRATVVNMPLEDHEHTEKIPPQLFEELDEDQLREVGRTEGLPYAVLDLWHNSGDLPVIYENDSFKVVELLEGGSD